jgi:hypothetical protein
MGITGLPSLLLTIGAITGIIGACRIYYLWSNGKQDIEREVILWVGGILFLTLIIAFHTLLF